MNAMTSPSTTMSVLAGIRRALAEATDLDEICDLRDRAEAIRHCVKTAAFGLKLQNQAAELKLCCERRAGQILAETPLQGGDRRSENGNHRATLEDMGISRSQSSRWQREGSLPEEDFVRYVQQSNEEGRELTANGLLHLARAYADATRRASDGKGPFARLVGGLSDLARRQKRFTCIYAEPPWSCAGKGGIARLPQRLSSLPVKLVAAPRAHLHLWVPPESLEAGLAVLRAWGFRYKAALVRDKAPLGYGNYWRQAHDMLLLGVRGGLPFHDSSLPSWIDGQHLSDRDRAKRFLP